MTTIAYLYHHPLLESPVEPSIWGLEVDRVYQDIGQRQQLQQLLADSQQTPPEYLLIRKLDELGDSLVEISDRLKFLESLGICIIVTEQDYNSSQLELKHNLTQIYQEIQTKQHSNRLRQGHAKNRLQAIPPPGKAPYGYRKGKDRYIIDRTTAPIVKDFFEQFLLFGSLRGAVRHLEKRYGKKISVSTGHRWLTNPVYRGNLAYNAQETLPNTHIPIISPEEAAQIDRLLRRNSRFPSRTATAPRSLAGLIVCQNCQSSLTVTRVTKRNQNQEYLYLRCNHCPLSPKCSAISYQEILEATITKICQDLPLAVAQINLESLEMIKNNWLREIATKQEILTQLPILTQQGILDQETAQLRNYKLQTEIYQLEQRIAQLPPENLLNIAQAVSLQQFWLDLSESERRFYLREFIKQIFLIRSDQAWELELQFIF
jgi:DNA invertase Pin-like site-specific DNA recombinase